MNRFHAIVWVEPHLGGRPERRDVFLVSDKHLNRNDVDRWLEESIIKHQPHLKKSDIQTEVAEIGIWYEVK